MTTETTDAEIAAETIENLTAARDAAEDRCATVNDYLVQERGNARRWFDALEDANVEIAVHLEGRRVLSEQVADLAKQNLDLRKQLLSADCRAAVA